MRKLVVIFILIMSVSVLGELVYDPDKVDPKIVKQIEDEMDSRKITTSFTKYLGNFGPDKFAVTRILKTPGKKNTYHGALAFPMEGKRSKEYLNIGGIFEARFDESGKLLEVELLTSFSGYERTVHEYFERLARKHLGEYVRTRGGGVVYYNRAIISRTFYRSFDEMVSDTNAGIGIGDEIVGGVKIFVFNEMNSQEEIDEFRENLFNLIKDLQKIKMRYETFYVYVVKPISLLSQEEVRQFTKGAGLSNCVEVSEKKENTCMYVSGVMQQVNRVMDETADGKEKSPKGVEFLKRRVDRVPYDGLGRFETEVYLELGLVLVKNKIYEVKKVEDIKFGDFRGEKVNEINYYKIGAKEEGK